jgi:hypothetical protein
MSQSPSAMTELTAKQRLAVSRQSLVTALDTPIWASLIEWGIKRCEPSSEQGVSVRSTQATNGRTPS